MSEPKKTDDTIPTWMLNFISQDEIEGEILSDCKGSFFVACLLFDEDCVLEAATKFTFTVFNFRFT